MANVLDNINLRNSVTVGDIDGGMVIRPWPGNSSTYMMIGTHNMGGSEYNLLTDGTNTFVSAGVGGYVSIRGGGNDTTPVFYVNNSYAYVDNGNFGVGFTTPQHRLVVNGNIAIDGLSGGYKINDITILDNSSTYTRISNPEGAYSIYIGDSGDSSNYYDNNYHNFRTAGGSSTLGVWNSTGLGIGTTSPSKKLDVAGDWILDGINGGHFENYTWGSQLDISELTSGGWARANRIVTSDSDASVFYGVFGGGTTLNYSYWNIGSAASESTNYNNSNGVFLLKNGNVGVGTITPSGKLTVDIDSSGAVLDLKRDDGVNGRLYLTFGAAQSNFYSSGLYTFNVAGSEKMRITSAGNVGIGTTTPDSLLDIGANNIITLDDTGSSTGFIGFGAYNNGTANIAQGFSYYGFGLEIDRPNQKIGFHSYDSNGKTSSGTDILVLKRDGNVGVGTTSPDAKLHVLGDTGIKIHTTTNGAGAKINFSDHSAGSYGQNGTLSYVHADGASYGSGNAFIFSSTEANMTVLADGKLMFTEGLYIKPSSGTGGGTRIIDNLGNFYGGGANITAINASNISTGTLSGDRLPWNDNDGFTGTYPIVWTATNGLYRSNWFQIRGSDDTILTRNINADGSIVLDGNLSGSLDNNEEGLSKIDGFIAEIGAENGSNQFILPGSTQNELAGADERFTVTATLNGTATSLSSNVFKSTHHYQNTSVSTNDTLVITITNASFNHSSGVGIVFSSRAWRARNITIETTTDGTNWTSRGSVTNYSYSSYYVTFNTGSTATTGIRYTLTNFNTTSTRIAHLFANNYAGGEAYHVDKWYEDTKYNVLNIDSSGQTDNYYLRLREGGSDRFTVYENGNNVYFNGGPGDTHFRPRQNGGSGNFLINGSNVGIGTSSPNAQLHVYSSGNGEIEVERASGALINLQAQSAVGVIGTDSNHPLYFKTNAGTRVAINTNGRVGIGNTSPSQLLDVSGIGIFGGTYRASLDGNSAGAYLRFGVDADIDSLGTIGTYGSAMMYETAQSSGHIFKTGAGLNGTERLRINSSGDVGIGTNSPTERLQVAGNIRAEAFGAEGSTFTRVYAPEGATYNGASSNTGMLTIILPQIGLNTMLKMTIRVFDYANNESFDVHVAGYLYGNPNTYWTRCQAHILCDPQIDRNFTVRFGNDSNGKGCVFIGETTSTWSYIKFGVVDAQFSHSQTALGNWIDGYNATVLSDLTGYTVYTSVSNTQATNWKRNGQNLYYSSGTGSVSIGTTNSDYKLNIEDDTPYGGVIIQGGNAPALALLDQSSTAKNLIYAQSTASAQGILRLSADDNNTGTDSSMEFRVDGTERMRIDSSGNVGIGTTSPDRKLHVDGAIGVNGSIGHMQPGLNVGTAQWNKIGTFYTSQGGNNLKLELHCGQGYNANFGQHSVVHVIFRTSNGSSNDNGFYGSCHWYVEGYIEEVTTIKVKQVSASQYEFYGYFNNFFGNSFVKADCRLSDYWVSDSSLNTGEPTGTVITANKEFATKSNSRFGGSVVVDGNVGIGTTSPGEKLHVEGRLRLGTTPVITSHDDITIDIDQNNNQSDRYFRVTKDGESSELFRVQENGQVGIGVTSVPTGYKMQVDGSILSSSQVSKMTISNIDYFGRVGQYYGAMQLAVWSYNNSTSTQSNTGTIQLGSVGPTSYQNNVIVSNGNLTVNGNGSFTGDVVAYSSSDKRLKDNVKPIENALDKVIAIGGYEFDWNDNQEVYEGHDVGVIAQEVEEVLPEVVETRKDGYKAVKYEKMVPLLIEAIKDQQKQIEELKALLNGSTR